MPDRPHAPRLLARCALLGGTMILCGFFFWLGLYQISNAWEPGIATSRTWLRAGGGGMVAIFGVVQFLGLGLQCITRYDERGIWRLWFGRYRKDTPLYWSEIIDARVVLDFVRLRTEAGSMYVCPLEFRQTHRFLTFAYSSAERARSKSSEAQI